MSPQRVHSIPYIALEVLQFKISHVLVFKLFPVRLRVKEVLVIKLSQVLQFLAEPLKMEHIGSDSANIYVRETWHCFNTCFVFLYQNGNLLTVYMTYL